MRDKDHIVVSVKMKHRTVTADDIEKTVMHLIQIADAGDHQYAENP
jgi:hypothetical protein